MENDFLILLFFIAFGLLVAILVVFKKFIEEVKKNVTKETEQKVLKEQEKLKKLREVVIEEQRQGYPWMAKLYADFEYVFDEEKAKQLRYKSHPAIKASEQVKLIGKEKRELRAQCKQLEYQLNFYETIFPWLEEFKEVPPKEAFEYASNADNEYDALRKWIDPQEYNCLPSNERNQLALDRWRQRKKSNWEIGIEYERYIGYLKEKDGYRIKYQGAIKGFEDMGRDLIAYKDNDIEVIQCKRWSQNKVIHEKHIFQLYGTMILEQIENPSRNITGIFIMTNTLSEMAMKCAEILNIKVKKIPMAEEYPVIKCNISQKTGERIYHLPFDQQYDKIAIDIHAGEFYAHTVAEAESMGFRRAHRWQGDKS